MAYFFPLLFAILGLSGVLLLALHFAFRSERYAKERIHDQRQWKFEPAKVLKVVFVNGSASAAMMGLTPVLLTSWFIRDDVGSLGGILFEVVATLLVYDFLYYFLHRFPFHQWPRMQRVHTLHHTVKHPTAIEALYASPLENALGLATFFISTAIVGPVSQVSFLLLVAIYSWLNIIIHCGLAPERGILWPLGYMARKHDRHHKSMKAGNYASITPLPDWLFGTLED